MKCPRCGNDCPDGSRFCERCGGPLGNVTATPVMTEASGESTASSIWSRRNLLIIAGTCTVALVIGITGGLWWRGHAHDAALAACENVVTRIRNGEDKASAVLANAEAVSRTTADQVADAATITALSKALAGRDRTVKASDYVCNASASASDLTATAQLATSKLDAQTHALAAIDKAVKAVEDSKATKSFDTNKASLQNRIDEANKLFDSSNGNVDGDGGRTALRSAIDAATSLLVNANAKQATKLAKALDALNAATDTVNKAVMDHTAKVKAADSNHCAAWVGTYETLGPAWDLVELHADCTGYSSMHQGIRQKMTYVPGSFKESGGGRYIWSTTTSYVADSGQADPDDIASSEAEPSVTRRFEIIPASGSSTGMILHDLSYVAGTTAEEGWFAPSGYAGGIPQ